ncbi:MAG TPA: hypothetical protein VIV56_07140 [Gemmatimonadales bacterium]
MKLVAKVESKGLLLALRKGQKRLAFAVSEALNETAKALQKEINKEAERKFTSRVKSFLVGTPARPGGAAAKITKFASVVRGVPYVELTAGLPPLGGRGTRKAPVLLPQFEKGALGRPRTGPALYVPITGGPARPTFTERVRLKYQFNRMLLHHNQAGQEVGRGGVFVLKTPKLPLGGVFTRVGGELELVWKAVPFVNRRPRPFFYATVRKHWRPTFAREMDRQIKATLAFQRYRAVA